MANYEDSEGVKKLRKLRELKAEAFVAMGLRGGGSWAHGCIAMDALEKG